MRIFCLTSNKYIHVLPGFAYLWNKFYSENQAVTIVGYEERPFNLPRNFNFLSLGKQADYTWSAGVIKLMNLIQDQHVLIMLEDYFISQPANVDIINETVRFMESHPEVAKVDLSDDRLKLSHLPYNLPDAPAPMIVSGDETNYQMSLQAAIWRRDMLLRFLDPKEDAWQTEKRGTKRIISARYAKEFNGLILGFLQPPLKYVNAIGGEGSHPQDWAKKRFDHWLWNDLKAKGMVTE